jgi:hypothetical protein
MTAISRKALVVSLHRLRRDRDKLLEICAKQRIFIQEQQRAYIELFNQLGDVRRGQAELRTLAHRYGLVCKAADAEREKGAPLQ